LDEAALESAALSEGEAGLDCAAPAAARKDKTKTERKILFMLDLTTLELILGPDSH
jgi:hypothetical protein